MSQEWKEIYKKYVAAYTYKYIVLLVAGKIYF